MARRLRWGVLTLALLLGWSGIALAQGAKLYELTENMKLVSKGQPRRTARSELMGFANVGTPLCPAAFVAALEAQGLLPPGTTQCTVNATGSDDVKLATGLGMFLGRFTVVVQGDNPVDGPELVVMRGNFRGKMNFSPALVQGVPYGTVSAQLTTDEGGKFPFSGTFRLPFLGSYSDPVKTGGLTLRQIFCPASPNPNPNLGGPDIAYVDTTVLPDGTSVANGQCIDVLPTELSLGFPTVRFDVNF